MFRYFTGYTNKSMEKTSSLKVLKMNTINVGSYYIYCKLRPNTQRTKNICF